MGILDELFSKSTGMKSILGDQINTPISKESLGGGGRSYDPNQQAISQDEFYQKKADDNKQRGQQISDYFKPEPFDPKKLGNDNRGYSIDTPSEKVTSQGGMVPPDKPDDLSQLNPNLFVKIFGRTKESMASEWKDKGGFEGLMANPGFTLGLSLMKTSSQGKPIGEGMFDAAIKSGAISKQYADQIKARSKILAPISQDQRDAVKGVLADDNYYEPNFLESLAKGNQSAKYREGIDDIADRADKLAKKESRQKGGREIRYGRKHIRQALQQLEDEGVLKKRDPSFFGIVGGSIQSTKGIKPRAEGGPIQSGQNYIVGEKGPEMFVSETNGTIINNDDSKVVSMLLESNPQLKNVSKARAVKILKARFPDYF